MCKGLLLVCNVSRVLVLVPCLVDCVGGPRLCVIQTSMLCLPVHFMLLRIWYSVYAIFNIR